MRAWPAIIQRSLSTIKHHATRQEPKKGDKVVVAMSGGVDSSVVAKLMSEKDYDLSAIFMRNWDTRDESGTDQGCEWEKDWEDVRRVCKKLDIPCTMVDLSRQYWTRVFQPCLDLWEKGYTPNPDVWCNREVKFGALMAHLTDILPSSGDYWLATGHYADKRWVSQQPPGPTAVDDKPLRPILARPKDRHKDQTYYLSAIPESSLARTLFPLAPFTKSEVRAIARDVGLPTAARPESMGICFIGEKRRFEDFLSQYIPHKPGVIVDLETGKRIGVHKGLWQYTIGQNTRISGLPIKAFVAKKDIDTNTIYAVHRGNSALYSRGFLASEWQWIWRDTPPSGLDDEGGLVCRIKFAYGVPDVPCTIRRGAETDSLRVTFPESQEYVAPGQIASVLVEDCCLGCGMIMESF